MEKLNLYKFEISGKKHDAMPIVVLIGEETILARGSWFDATDEYIAGMVKAFELSNFDVKLNETKVFDPQLKENPDAGKLMKLWNSQK